MQGDQKHPKSLTTSSADVVQFLLARLLVCPNNVWPVAHWVKLRQRYSRVGAINNKRSIQCQLLKFYTRTTIRGGAKDISMDDACKVCCTHTQTSCLRRCALAHEAFHKESPTTHATPIVSQSALGAVWVAYPQYTTL